MSKAKDTQLELNLKDKDADIAETGAKAADANARAANADKEAAKANERAGNLEVEAATQRERAAKAEKDLLELRERIKPRRLTTKQGVDFVKVLRRLPGVTVDFGYTAGGGDEGFTFARQVMSLFK